MTKPRGIRWLETQTGQDLSNASAAQGDDSRHLSVRVSAALFEQLETLAEQRGESVSQSARRLLSDRVARPRNPDRDAIDQVIAALQQVRAQMGATAG